MRRIQLISLKKPLERAKGFEPSTPTLARLCSILQSVEITHVPKPPAGMKPASSSISLPRASVDPSARSGRPVGPPASVKPSRRSQPGATALLYTVGMVGASGALSWPPSPRRLTIRLLMRSWAARIAGPFCKISVAMYFWLIPCGACPMR